MSANILGYGVGNKLKQKRLQHYGETVNRYFGKALDVIYLLAKALIKLVSWSSVQDILKEILRYLRYIYHFKVNNISINCFWEIDKKPL